MLSLHICIGGYCKLFTLDDTARCERSHYLICHVCFAVFMHHIIILTQQLVPVFMYCTWLLKRFRPNKKRWLQFSESKHPSNIKSDSGLREHLQQHHVCTMSLILGCDVFRRQKPIRNKWAVTGLMTVTKVEFDCQSLFCLLVGERAISIALTAHQDSSNWILAHNVSF